MQARKPVLGLGLGMNLLVLWTQTKLPYNLVFMQDPVNLGEEFLHNDKFKKAVVDDQTGYYFSYDKEEGKLKQEGYLGFTNNFH